MQHIFSKCEAFKKFRVKANRDVRSATSTILEKASVSQESSTRIMEIAKSLFSDCNQTRPLARTQYYLGHTPKIKDIISIKNGLSVVKCKPKIFTPHGIYTQSDSLVVFGETSCRRLPRRVSITKIHSTLSICNW